jgi:hypothetical protein
MGADTVEAVASKSHASMPLQKYDYVVLKDGGHRGGEDSVKYVPWSWVKDCLIANRILPLPVETEDEIEADSSSEGYVVYFQLSRRC